MMLTDTEVADTARSLLAGELADLTPPAGLLADVRARHASTQRSRRAATAALAAVAVAGLTATIVTSAGGFAPGASGPTAAANSQPRTGHAAGQTQTIVLDGYAIRVTSPLRLAAGLHGQLTATMDGRRIPLTLLLYGGRVPTAAVRVSSWQRPAYLLSSGGRLDLYLPFPAVRGYRSLILSGTGLSEHELLRIAASITVAGHPGFLNSTPPSSHPDTHCPCG